VLILDELKLRLARHYLQQVLEVAQEDQAFQPVDKEWPQIYPLLTHIAYLPQDEAVDLSLKMISGLHPYWYVRGMVDDGESWCQHAIQICTVTGRNQEKGEYLLSLGTLYQEFGDLDQSQKSLQQALNIFHETDDLNGQRKAFEQLGTAYRKLDQPELSIKSYKDALALGIKTSQGLGVIFGKLGVTYKELGNVKQAKECFHQALIFFQNNNDRRNIGLALEEQGALHQELGETSKAIDCYQQALEIACEISDRISEGTNLNNLGRSYFILGKIERCLESHEQAAEIFRQVNIPEKEGRCLANLGNAYHKRGELNKAINCYRDSLAIAQECSDLERQEYALNNLGSIYWEQAQPQQAIFNYQQALMVAQEIGDYTFAELVQNNLENLEGEPCPKCEYTFLNISPCPYCGHIEWGSSFKLIFLNIFCLSAAISILFQIDIGGWYSLLFFVLLLCIVYIEISLLQPLRSWPSRIFKPIRRLQKMQDISSLLDKLDAHDPYIRQMVIDILCDMELNSTDLEQLSQEQQEKALEVLDGRESSEA